MGLIPGWKKYYEPRNLAWWCLYYFRISFWFWNYIFENKRRIFHLNYHRNFLELPLSLLIEGITKSDAACCWSPISAKCCWSFALFCELLFPSLCVWEWYGHGTLVVIAVFIGEVPHGQKAAAAERRELYRLGRPPFEWCVKFALEFWCWSNWMAETGEVWAVEADCEEAACK